MTTANTDYPLHHIEFTKNDGTVVKAVIADAEGNTDPTLLRAIQKPRLAAQLRMGEAKHGDYEFPYSPVEQRSWAGGRGQKDVESDMTRYYDGFNLDATIDGHAFLTGQEVYTEGYRDFVQVVPVDHNSELGKGVFTNLEHYLVFFDFTPDSDFTLESIWIRVKRYGNPGTVTVSIYADDAGDNAYDQTTEHTKGTLYEEDAPEEHVPYWVRIDFGETFDLTADTKYWVVVQTSEEVDDDNLWRFVVTNDPDDSELFTGDNESDPTDHYTFGTEMLHRLLDEDHPFIAKFFRYRGALWAMLSYDEGSDPLDGTQETPTHPPKLYLNGDMGVVSSANKYSITDSSKSWDNNEHRGSIMWLYDGSAASVPRRWRLIVGNDADTLLLDDNLSVTPNPDVDDTWYVITNSDKWTEVTIGDSDYGIRGKVTDVLVTHQTVYFACGDIEPMMRFRRFMDDGSLVDEWQNEEQAFTFVEEAPDSLGRNRIWMAKGNFPPRVEYSEMKWTNWLNATEELDLQYNRLTQNSSCEQESPGVWEAVNAPETHERSAAGKGFLGKYAWHVKGDDGRGSKQSIHVEADKTYNVNVTVWVTSVGTEGYIKSVIGGEEMARTPTNTTSADAGNAWFHLKGHYVSSSEQDVDVGVYIEDDNGEFYFDEFEVVEIPTYLEDLSCDRITNLIRYGDPERLWVLTEGGIYEERQGYFKRVPLEEYKNCQDDRNGAVAFTWDVNLLLSFMDGIQSYYRENLTNISPMKGEGLPRERQGRVSGGVAYAGKFFISYDAGPTGYSHILVNNGRGYHEIYRAPYGEQIRSLFIQPIPGKLPDKLWFSQGSDLVYVPILPNTLREV